ncbi:acyltransferase family protein [Vibrio alginolyticus]
MNFRYDINGLRAIAVIAVVIFHFNPTWVPGGFAGVDVFFVISGFLMTGIIFRGMENENFNLFKFYVARANRIIPALAVLCITLLIFGWFYLTPIEYKALGGHVASSTSFLSNILYWRESGYFDASSQEKWLLHTWSLSVEWQFYIIYPVMLVVLKRFISLKNLKRMIVIATALGFVFSVVATMKWPNAAYYLLPTRAWEMMMGGVAFLFPWRVDEAKKKVIEIVGLLLILTSYTFVSSDVPWPGHFALLPILGAYLMIVANRQSSVITNNVLFQYLGKWSYSVYLWHWPIFVYGYSFDIENWYLYGMPLSIILGFLSFSYVEGIKFNSFKKWVEVFKVKPIYMVLVIGTISSYTWLSQGFDSRYPELKGIMSNIVMPNRENDNCFYSFSDKDVKIDLNDATNCILGDKTKEPKTLLFGDSFAGHLDPFFNQFFKNNKASYNSVSTNWCYPSFKSEFKGSKSSPSYQQCLLNREFLHNVIVNRKYDNIILAGSWDGLLDDNKHFNDLMEVVDIADKNDVRLLVMPTPPRYKRGVNPISYWSRLLLVGEDESKVSRLLIPSKANDLLEGMLTNTKAKFLQQRDIYSPDGMFELNGMKVPYTLEGYHISLLGSSNAYKHFSSMNSYSEMVEFLDLL